MGEVDERIQNLCAEKLFANKERKAKIDQLVTELQKIPEAKAIRDMQNANVGKERK